VNPAQACHDGRIALTELRRASELRVVADCDYRRQGSGPHRPAHILAGQGLTTHVLPVDHDDARVTLG